jgi:hypothetical protein
MKKIFICILFMLSLSAGIFAQYKDAFDQTYPASAILKPTLTVRAVRDLNYWKQPAAKNFWSWMPKLDFMMTGPVDDASYFTYEFFTPEGKPWYSLDTGPFAIQANNLLHFESEAVPSWTDKRSTILTGTFSYKVTLKNSLQNTAKVMAQGKFKVGKQFAGTAAPDFKNQYVFYVDQDWSLPMAYLNFDIKQNPNSPQFQAGLWFRGDFKARVVAYLFYNGKQIANSENNAESEAPIISPGDSENQFRYEFWQFKFYKARLFDNNGEYKDAHIFRQNPGSYEIKVLLDGELTRNISFTVGKDGLVTDNNIAANNGIKGFGIIVPAKVIPVKEGTLDLLSWKNDAFYGNPLAGFTAP